MTDQEHQQLLDCLADIRGRFILSGYPSELYRSWAKQHQFGCVEIPIDNKAECVHQNHCCRMAYFEDFR